MPYVLENDMYSDAEPNDMEIDSASIADSADLAVVKRMKPEPFSTDRHLTYIKMVTLTEHVDVIELTNITSKCCLLEVDMMVYCVFVIFPILEKEIKPFNFNIMPFSVLT